MNIYDNALACRKYYEKNKGNPEFRLRKACQSRKLYYKKRYPVFWNIFQAWKVLALKEVNKRIKINNFLIRRNILLLKKVIDSWKLYERTPKSSKPIYNILCSFN